MNKIQDLLKKELTRKEFIQVVGLMLLSAVGISGMLGSIDKTLSGTKGQTDDYGVNSYGG